MNNNNTEEKPSASINIPIITTEEKFKKFLEFFDIEVPPLTDLAQVNLQIVLEDEE